jgi:hypothetical protein
VPAASSAFVRDGRSPARREAIASAAVAVIVS